MFCDGDVACCCWRGSVLRVGYKRGRAVSVCEERRRELQEELAEVRGQRGDMAGVFSTGTRGSRS